jgi:hypothetical protein
MGCGEISGRSRQSTNGKPGYVSYSNPVNAGRSLCNGEPSIERPQRNSPTRRCNPEIRDAIEDLARDPATEVPRSPRDRSAPSSAWRRLALRGVTSALGVPGTRSSHQLGCLACRLSGHVPKSPCATSVNPGLGRAKSLQTRIIRRRRTSPPSSTWPRLRTRARNFGRCRENGVAMRHPAYLRPRPISEKQAPDPDPGRPAPRSQKDGPARR